MAMATYNGERFLQEQLDSLARQTLLPCELVVCDDGSADGTMDILKRFADVAPFRVRIYQNDVRLGYCENFLRAVGLCTGDLVAFSDQDDVWFPSKLAACSEALRSDRSSMVIHLASLADTELNPLGRTWPHLPRFGKKCRFQPTLLHMDVAGMTMVFRRSISESLSRNDVLRGMFRGIFSGHDLAVRFLAAAYGSVIPLRQVLAIHRCHDRNTSNSHGAVAATASAYVLGAQGVPARISAAVRWLTTHAGLAQRAGSQSYARQAETIRKKADALRQAAEIAEEPVSSLLARTAVILSRRAEAISERALIYGEPRHMALGRFCRMVLHGCYGPNRLGGLGFRSLAKDFLMTVNSPMRRMQIGRDQA